MAEQLDHHVQAWAQFVTEYAAREMHLQLRDTASAGGISKAVAIANGAVAGAAQYLSEAMGPAWVADALAQFQAVAADYAAREAAAVPMVLQ